MNSSIRNPVPMAFVEGVPRSVAFFEKFGLRVQNTHAPEGAAFRAQLLAPGVQADESCFPFFSPKGEFRVMELDGDTLMMSHV